MSNNSLLYDACTQYYNVNQSVSPLGYLLDTDKYENINKCRIGKGILGGTNVSHIKGNLVDLESDLYGITRKASLCPDKKFFSKCSINNPNNCQPDNIFIEGTPNTKERIINTDMEHLPTCQMVDYKEIYLPKPIKINKIIQ